MRHNQIQVKRLRLQFGIRSLLVVTALAAWSCWQWTIADQRQSLADRLEDFGFFTFRNGSVPEERLEELCRNMVYERVPSDPMRRGAIGTFVGWDNWEGVTVVVASIHVVDSKDVIAALQRFPGLTSVVIFSGNPDIDQAAPIIRFKDRLQEKRPNIQVKHVHLPNLVG